MTGRVVAFRVGEETFPAIDAQRKKIGERWRRQLLPS
jgi:hypothetical protein